MAAIRANVANPISQSVADAGRVRRAFDCRHTQSHPMITASAAILVTQSLALPHHARILPAPESTIAGKAMGKTQHATQASATVATVAAFLFVRPSLLSMTATSAAAREIGI